MAIFSEMRTGKTPIALRTFQQWPVSNLLIITPNVLQQQWQKSVEEWLAKPTYVITYLDFFLNLSDEEAQIYIKQFTFLLRESKLMNYQKYPSSEDYCKGFWLN